MSYKKKIAGILSTGTFWFLGGSILIIDKVIDLNSVMKAFWFASLGALIAGTIGFFIGKIFDDPPKKQPEIDNYQTDSDLLINDIMLDDLKNMNSTNNE